MRRVLDGEVQVVAAAASVAVMFGAWVFSVALRDASVADIAWGLAFVAIAWAVEAFGPGAGDRSLLNRDPAHGLGADREYVERTSAFVPLPPRG